MTTPETRVWRTDIEGLRGLAVLLVVCFHAGVPMLRGAFVAVDVFFVLSGFFLATSLIRQLVTTDGFSVRDTYARRLWRLLPTLVLVAMVTLATAMFLYAPIDRPAVAQHLTPVALFVSNLSFASNGVNYFSAGENPYLHTWTLGVEWQLALILPTLIAMLAWFGSKRGVNDTGQDRRMIMMSTVFTGLAIICGLSFVCALFVGTSAPMWAYFGPHTRFWGFTAGALAAFLVGGGQSLFGSSPKRVSALQIAGLTAIFVPALLFDRSMGYSGAIALAPVGGTLLMLSGGSASVDTPVGRVLSARPFTSLGRVSYAWYLWHWPLMVLGAVLIPGIGVVGRLACGLAGLVLANLTHKYVERPLNERVMPRILAGNPLLFAMGVCMVLVFFAHLAAVSSSRFVRTTVHSTYAAAREDHMNHSCWVSSVDEQPRRECAFGDVRSETKIALLGDSHAEHWLGGLERAGTAHGWSIEAHVMGGCPVSDFSGLTSGAVTRRYFGCNQYREAMLTHLVAQRPRAVILSSFDSYIESGALNEYYVHESAWTRGLRRTYERLSNAGIPVIVIRGTPRIPFDVPGCLSRRAANLMFASDCTYAPNRAFIARARAAQDLAARGLNVRFIDMNDQVCATSRCVTERDGIVMFTDTNHLTASFARSLGLLLGDRIAAALGTSSTTSLIRKASIEIRSPLALRPR